MKICPHELMSAIYCIAWSYLSLQQAKTCNSHKYRVNEQGYFAVCTCRLNLHIDISITFVPSLLFIVTNTILIWNVRWSNQSARVNIVALLYSSVAVNSCFEVGESWKVLIIRSCERRTYFKSPPFTASNYKNLPAFSNLENKSLQQHWNTVMLQYLCVPNFASTCSIANKRLQ